MNDQEQIQLLKEYIAYLEARLLHSDKMHEHAMEMVRKLMEKLK
jgi:hypothetical protein